MALLFPGSHGEHDDVLVENVYTYLIRIQLQHIQCKASLWSNAFTNA